jgi:hypothetical protein
VPVQNPSFIVKSNWLQVAEARMVTQWLWRRLVEKEEREGAVTTVQLVSAAYWRRQNVFHLTRRWDVQKRKYYYKKKYFNHFIYQRSKVTLAGSKNDSSNFFSSNYESIVAKLFSYISGKVRQNNGLGTRSSQGYFWPQMELMKSPTLI